MLATALALVILAGVGAYLMTPEERVSLARQILIIARRTFRASLAGSPGEPFDDFMLARTRWTIVTPAIIAVNTLVFAFMVFGAGALDDPGTLIDWGGNFTLRTTNGEWWRVVAAAFVHAGWLHLLATLAALVSLGFVLERMVGPFAFATTYLTAGVVSGVVTLWTTSVKSVSVGASGAVFGIYGLLLAVLMWIVVSRLPVSVPAITVRRVAAGAALFLLYNLLTDHLTTASEVAGLLTGLAGGLFVARGVARGVPPPLRPALVFAATVLIAVAGAVPWRGTIDVTREIEKIVSVEQRTTTAYDAACAQFRERRVPIDALVRTINQTIRPELQAIRAHLKALKGVPREHAPLLATAEEYFQLREQSWQRRAAGLIPYNTRALREAEETERAALEVFEKMKPAS